jgi:alpha-1,6-mannosyltransferase
VQDDKQSLQALDHMTGVVEEDLRHHHRAVAAYPDQVAVPQVLMDLRHGDAEHLRDTRQVEDVLGRIEHVLCGWNAAHRPECRTHDASA